MKSDNLDLTTALRFHCALTGKPLELRVTGRSGVVVLEDPESGYYKPFLNMGEAMEFLRDIDLPDDCIAYRLLNLREHFAEVHHEALVSTEGREVSFGVQGVAGAYARVKFLLDDKDALVLLMDSAHTMGNAIARFWVAKD